RRLDTLAQEHDSSPEFVLLACWYSLLSRLTARSDVVVDHFTDGRRQDELRDAVGLFARPLPVPLSFEEDATFADVLRRTQEATEQAVHWQEYVPWTHIHAAEHAAPVAFEFELGPVAFRSGDLRFSWLRQIARGPSPKLMLRVIRHEHETL